MQIQPRHIIPFLLLLAVQAGAQNKDPGIVFSTLLNEVRMRYDQGTVKVNYLTAIHLPDVEPVEGDTSGFAFKPTSGRKLTTIVKYEGFEEPFATMRWYAKKQIDPLWSLTKYDVEKSTQPASEDGWMLFKTPGNFTMEFHLDDDLIYKFPFTVSKLPASTGGDPLDKYFLDGPWEQYAYLFYLGGMPSMNIKFVMWLRNKDHRPTKGVKVLGILMKDGAPVAKTGEGATDVTLTPEWVRFEFPLGSSVRDNEGKTTFKGIQAQNLLNVPGNYEMMITVDNQMYGTYPFAVEPDGKFRLIQEQDPERTKPVERIIGGKDTIWLKRKK